MFEPKDYKVIPLHDQEESGYCKSASSEETGCLKTNFKMGTKQSASSPLHTFCNSVTSQQMPANFMEKFITVLKSAVPFLVFLLFYGMNVRMHVLPDINDLRCVHFNTLGKVEESIFGVQPHRLVSYFHNIAFDFLSAVPYLVHYTLPVIFPLYLLCAGRVDDIAKFYWLLGWLVWAIYLVWLVFPHTPPWVIDNMKQHNTSVISVVMEHREGCAFTRLDKVMGLPFFYNMFQGNPVPYASFPSGHVAWPTAIHLSGGPGGNYFFIYVLWVIWATMYSCHHYLLDALAGMLIVVVTKKIVTFLADKAICSHDYKCRCHGIACPLHIV